MGNESSQTNTIETRMQYTSRLVEEAGFRLKNLISSIEAKIQQLHYNGSLADKDEKEANKPIDDFEKLSQRIQFIHHQIERLYMLDEHLSSLVQVPQIPVGKN